MSASAARDGRRPARRGAASGVLAGLVAAALAACGGEDAPRVGPVRAPPAGSSSLAPAEVRPADPDEPRLGPYPRSQFYIQRDLFVAADQPRCVPAAEARFLRESDEVFGLVIQAKARAYAVTMLSYHHVVNDVIEGIPVAVTY